MSLFIAEEILSFWKHVLYALDLSRKCNLEREA